MDIEQLKLILETISAAGEGTKDLTLIYFAYLFTGLIIKMTLLGALILGIYKIGAGLLRKMMFEHDVMDALGISMYLTRGERMKAIEWMKKGKQTRP